MRRIRFFLELEVPESTNEEILKMALSILLNKVLKEYNVVTTLR